jgi:hypothetical protein
VDIAFIVLLPQDRLLLQPQVLEQLNTWLSVAVELAVELVEAVLVGTVLQLYL